MFPIGEMKETIERLIVVLNKLGETTDELIGEMRTLREEIKKLEEIRVIYLLKERE